MFNLKWTPIESKRLPNFAEELNSELKIFEQNKYSFYWVGGCVRDWLLGREIHDLDAATDAPMDFLKKKFPNTKSFGGAYGVLNIRLSAKKRLDLSILRKEGPYSDRRHPDFIEKGDLESDAKRRDFTLNSIYLNSLKSEILDPFDGQKSIKNKILETIGPAELRFEEDILRVLRALRFGASLKFELSEEIKNAIHKNKKYLGLLSGERVWNEIKVIFEQENFIECLKVVKRFGVLDFLIPELEKIDLDLYLSDDFPQEPEKRFLSLFKENFSHAKYPARRFGIRFKHDVLKEFASSFQGPLKL